MYGAAAGLVNVNTIEGATFAEVNDSEVKAGQFSANAENEDHLKVTDVTATGAIGSLGASVVVSYLKGSSVANLRNSTVTADNLTVSSLQNHFVKGTVAFASGGLGTIGANVFSLVIGSGDNPFASNRQDLGSAEDTVNKYLSNYASSGSGSLGFINESKDLTQEEKDKIVGSAAAADASTSSGSGKGTSVLVSGNQLTVVSADVFAKEDSKGGNIDVTLGSGSAGAGVLAASVITLRRHHNNQVNLSGNSITADKNFNVLNSLEGKTNLEAIQTSLALASGTAAYADAEVTGGASTIWDGNVSGGIKLEEPKPDGSKDEGNKAEENKPQTTNPVFEIKTENKSEIHLKSFGITVAAASGGGMVAEIRDKSRVENQILNSTINSSFNASAVRQQNLFAESTAGYGGAINGVGALAKVYDGTKGSLSARTLFNGNSVSADISLTTNNRPDIKVKSYGAGAGGLGIGVVQSIAETRGKVVSEVSGNVFSNANLTVAAGAGLGGSDGDESEALKMTADSQTYGGAIIASIPVNTSELTNSNQVESKIELSGDSSLENFTSVTEGSAVYLSKTTAGTGGTIASGNNSAEVNHKLSVKNEVSSSSSVGLKNAAVTASNKEKATVLADSAGGGIILAEGTDLDANAAQVKHTDRSDTTLTASGADVTIVQRSADPSAAVVVKNVDAGDQIFVLNAGGPISLEKSVSGNSTMIFVSQDGYKPDRNIISSRSNRVGIFAAAPQMLSVFDRFGREISYLSKDSLQADQRHHHYALYRYGEETHMPASRLFFNGYRAESVSPSNGLIKEALLFVTNRWQVNMGEEGAEEETED